MFSFSELLRGWCDTPLRLLRRAGRGRKRDQQVAAVLRGEPLESRAVMSVAVAAVYDQMLADAMYHLSLIHI